MDISGSERIAREILKRGNLDQITTVEVHRLQEIKRSPSICEVSPNRLVVKASHPAEVRQLVGRYVVKKKWPLHKWHVAVRPYLVAFLGFALIMTISALQFFPVLDFPQYLVSMAIASDAAIALVVIGFSYLMAIRHTRWRRHLIEQLRFLGALTEYDGMEYQITHYPGGITWPVLCLPAILTVMLRTEIPQLGFNVYPPIILLVTILTSVPSIFISLQKPTRDEPCWDEIGDEEGSSGS